MSPTTLNLLWVTFAGVSIVFALGVAYVFTLFIGQRRHINSQSKILEQLKIEINERSQAEAKYKGIFENAIEGIFQLTPDGQFISINPALANIYGYETPQEMMASMSDTGKTLFVRAKDSREFKSSLDQGGAIVNREYRSHRRDSKRIWISINAHPVRNQEGSILYYEGTIEDVTERKRTEELQRNLSKRIFETQEAERRRISLELHDSVNQMLSSARYRLKSLEEERVLGKRIQKKYAGESRTLVEMAIQELRRISRNLRPSSLDDLGLVSAVRSLCEEFKKRTNIGVRFAYSKIPSRLPSTLELALFRIIQETLNNVEKHSKATEVTLTLRREDSFICATIIDNGKGFDPDELARKKEVPGLGLVGMKERASFFEGTVSIDSVRNRGTEVGVRIPLKDIR